MGQTSTDTDTWVPDACTLPTVQRPFRLAEFDAVFADVLAVHRSAPRLARLELRPDPAVAARVADLCVRETACCTFFEFAVLATGGRLGLTVRVPVRHVPVLDAVVARATASVRAAR